MKDIFDFRLEVLLLEFQELQNAIRHYDNVQLVIRGWSITLFSGVVALALQQHKPSILILALIIVPMFWTMNTMSALIQRRFISRYNRLEHFLRCKNHLIDSWERGTFKKLNFPDIMAKNSVRHIKSKTQIKKNALNPQVSLLYVSQLFTLPILYLLQTGGVL